ncbi:DinB family protein [Ferruginibacter profundus]
MTEQIIQQIINAWQAQNKTVTDFFNKYSDDVYLKEVAPGRNRPTYLLGHLIASNDGMLPLFGLGKRLFPQYEAMFIKNPDKAVADIPSIAILKNDWEKLNNTLSDHFSKMTTADWLSKHTAVSDEDFAKEPLRNKLNVLIGRTNHQSYHRGQVNLLNA